MADPVVHVHTSRPQNFFVNSFLIEGDRRLVLVDAQFVLSEVAAVVEMARSLGKPLAAILVTHPHPDHFNGLDHVLSAFPGTPVYATAATRQGISETAEPKRAYWTPIVGADYPQHFRLPDQTLVDGQELDFDGLRLKIVDFGAAECSDNISIALPALDAVIASDILYNRVHPWLVEGRSGLWLAALAKAKSRFAGARRFFAGHGSAGGPDALEVLERYILDFRTLVAESLANGPLDEAQTQAIASRMASNHPGWPLEMVVAMSVPGLAAELAELGR
jgi:glyoxylase-like metal-dependent hydrolase (beta-lactamase superfamily II)